MKSALKPPSVPADLAGAFPLAFRPDPRLEEWIRTHMIESGGPLEIPEHAHLRNARIGVLWTNHAAKSKGRMIAGTAEMPSGSLRGQPWVKARQEEQLAAWFGDVPDFLLTFDARYAAEANAPTLYALFDHELCHCAQARDPFGAPRFNQQTGAPIFEIRGHDVEQFVGVTERWGAEASGVAELVAAAKRKPLMAGAVRIACGTRDCKAA